MAAAMMGVSMAGPALAAQQPIVQVTPSKKAKRGLFNNVVLPSGAALYGRKPAGVSMAQQQRASKKVANRARNKRAHRGRHA